MASIFMACLLPFAMGTWVARYGIRLNAAVYAAAWAVFIGGCFNVFLWIVSPVALTIMVLPAVKVRPHIVRAPLEWLGGISAALFTVHPVVRCFFNPRTAADVYATFACYIAASVLLAWALSAVLRLVPKPKIKWTNNK